MKIVISVTLLKAHPDIESLLWSTACVAKELDPDIILTGLRVRATASKTSCWSGSASPFEDSMFYGTKVTHPAGKIVLRYPPGVAQRSIITLFAHELRHIGQFHRGRKKYGIMGWDDMTKSEAEEDCYEFEAKVAEAMMAGTATCRGSEDVC